MGGPQRQRSHCCTQRGPTSTHHTTPHHTTPHHIPRRGICDVCHHVCIGHRLLCGIHKGLHMLVTTPTPASREEGGVWVCEHAPSCTPSAPHGYNTCCPRATLQGDGNPLRLPTSDGTSRTIRSIPPPSRPGPFPPPPPTHAHSWQQGTLHRATIWHVRWLHKARGVDTHQLRVTLGCHSHHPPPSCVVFWRHSRNLGYVGDEGRGGGGHGQSASLQLRAVCTCT